MSGRFETKFFRPLCSPKIRACRCRLPCLGSMEPFRTCGGSRHVVMPQKVNQAPSIDGRPSPKGRPWVSLSCWTKVVPFQGSLVQCEQSSCMPPPRPPSPHERYPLHLEGATLPGQRSHNQNRVDEGLARNIPPCLDSCGYLPS